MGGARTQRYDAEMGGFFGGMREACSVVSKGCVCVSECVDGTMCVFERSPGRMQ